MDEKDYNSVEREVILFALETEEIVGVSRGCNPEEGNRVYWLLTGNKPYSRQLEDKISGLSYHLKDAEVMHWPTTPERITNPFLGEVIWRR